MTQFAAHHARSPSAHEAPLDVAFGQPTHEPMAHRSRGDVATPKQEFTLWCSRRKSPGVRFLDIRVSQTPASQVTPGFDRARVCVSSSERRCNLSSVAEFRFGDVIAQPNLRGREWSSPRVGCYARIAIDRGQVRHSDTRIELEYRDHLTKRCIRVDGRTAISSLDGDAAAKSGVGNQVHEQDASVVEGNHEPVVHRAGRAARRTRCTAACCETRQRGFVERTKFSCLGSCGNTLRSRRNTVATFRELDLHYIRNRRKRQDTRHIARTRVASHAPGNCRTRCESCRRFPSCPAGSTASPSRRSGERARVTRSPTRSRVTATRFTGAS